MADVESIKRRGRPPKTTDGDGEISLDSVREVKVTESKGQSDWELVNLSIMAAEDQEGANGRRVVKVFFDGKAPCDHWHGVYGSAVIERGDTGYQLSDGSKYTI